MLLVVAVVPKINTNNGRHGFAKGPKQYTPKNFKTDLNTSF